MRIIVVTGVICKAFAIQLFPVCVTNSIRVTIEQTDSYCIFIVRTYLFNAFIMDIFAQALRNTFNMPHQGEILQEAIKNSGISITRIVEELGITRPTIYRKFKEETLDYNIVKRIGEIINHDFSTDFTVVQQSSLPFVTSIIRSAVTNSVTPRVTQLSNVDNESPKQLLMLQSKYIALLEAYNELLLKVYGPK